MAKLLTCVECGETGAGDCPEFHKIMCDDCYTVERVTIMHEQGLNNLFEVDEYLNKQDVI